jgi:hypothetical protein
VIVTPRLAQHFETHRLAPAHLALPIGNTTIKRIRRLLGHHRQIDRSLWWEERIADLSDLTLDQFAAKHSVSSAAAAHARHAFFGHKLRPSRWWARKDVADILMSDKPRSEIADVLDISVGSVGRLRWMLQTMETRKAPRPYGWSEKRLISLRAMLTSGRAATEVSAATGIDVDKIYHAISRGYLPSPGPSRPSQSLSMGQAVEMVRAGATYSEAARTYGFTATGVAAACRRAGVESPKAHFVKRRD